MIQRDPAQRKTANEYLAEQKGKALPEYFYKFFQSYMQIYSTDPAMMPDQGGWSSMLLSKYPFIWRCLHLSTSHLEHVFQDYQNVKIQGLS